MPVNHTSIFNDHPGFGVFCTVLTAVCFATSVCQIHKSTHADALMNIMGRFVALRGTPFISAQCNLYSYLLINEAWRHEGRYHSNVFIILDVTNLFCLKLQFNYVTLLMFVSFYLLTPHIHSCFIQG